LSADHINKINALFQRLKRLGCITSNITASDFIEKSDLDLLKKINYPGHSPNHLLPPKRFSHNLLERGHIFDLPHFNTALHNKKADLSQR